MTSIQEPESQPGVDFALWQLGFRPFYLLASTHAALSSLFWALQFAGWLPLTYLRGPLWHAHEMLFGFILPVIVGFLLTAGQTWTKQKTLHGIPLMLLALTWLCARVLVLTPFGWASAVANAAFPWAAAVALAGPFLRAKAWRNYFFLVLLVLLGFISLGVHLETMNLAGFLVMRGLQLSMDIVLFIMVIMTGRILPPFTANGVPGAKPRRLPWLEKVAPAIILLILAADTFGSPQGFLVTLLLTATVLHVWRLSLWQSVKTLRTPLVWVLHAAYAWIVLHLALRALSEAGWVGPSMAIHALTVGAMGTLIMGMMTRTARGHTGRPLQADHFDTTGYVLVQLAALIRVFLPLALPGLIISAVMLSGLLWSLAFGLYTVRYWPVLTRARIDSRAGCGIVASKH